MQALIDRLKRFGPLSRDQITAMEAMNPRRRTHERGAVLRRSDEASGHVFCLVEGWAIRCRLLPDGQRQILAILIPGDVCDLQALVGADQDHHIIALTDLTVNECPASEFEALLVKQPDLARLFLAAKVEDEALLREHVVRLGRRKARERVLHLLLEICERQRLADTDAPRRLAYTLNRETLADLLGLSPVHVSRSLAALNRAGVIAIDRGCIELADIDQAASQCGYDGAYLRPRAPLQSPQLQNTAQA
ncbi:MAG: Crp/Fnr family transcriptional regulator [Oceanicaulis sp.]